MNQYSKGFANRHTMAMPVFVVKEFLAKPKQNKKRTP